MEKYARQAVSEGVKNVEDLRVGGDSEIYRVLNLHYNRNNHIEVWGPQVRNTNTHTLPFILFSYRYCFTRFREKTSMYIFATQSDAGSSIDRFNEIKLSVLVSIVRLHEIFHVRLCGSL